MATVGKRRRRRAPSRRPRPGTLRRIGDVADVIRRTRNAAGRLRPRAALPRPSIWRGPARPSSWIRCSRCGTSRACRSGRRASTPDPHATAAAGRPAADPRRQAQRRDLSVRSSRCRHRQRDRQALPPPSQSGVPQDYDNLPRDLDVHIVMDNCATHKTEAIRNRFAKRPRVHFTPTSASSRSNVSC